METLAPSTRCFRVYAQTVPRSASLSAFLTVPMPCLEGCPYCSFLPSQCTEDKVRVTHEDPAISRFPAIPILQNSHLSRVRLQLSPRPAAC